MDYQNFIQITNQTLNEDFSQKPYLLLDCSQLKKCNVPQCWAMEAFRYGGMY